MRIDDVLRRKGDEVVTISPRATVTELVALLAEHGIGATVVSEADRRLQGIVSERDVVRGLQREGAAVLERPVAEIMTEQVHTCGPGETVVDLAVAMTTRRIRHVPVVDEGGVLVGIVSIGDVVKHRIDELTKERDHLEAYISS